MDSDRLSRNGAFEVKYGYRKQPHAGIVRSVWPSDLPCGWCEVFVELERVSPEKRVFTVKPGEEITGNLMLEYSNYWGDRKTNFIDLAPLFTPAEHEPRRTRIRFTAPETPGIYHIVLAFDAEESVEDFMAGTNATGKPRVDPHPVPATVLDVVVR